MPATAEFRDFARLFLQGSLEWTSDEKSWIDQAVHLLDKEKRATVYRYIGELVESDLDNGELRDIWNSHSPNFGISEGDMRTFLSTVRERLLESEGKE